MWNELCFRWVSENVFIERIRTHTHLPITRSFPISRHRKKGTIRTFSSVTLLRVQCALCIDWCVKEVQMHASMRHNAQDSIDCFDEFDTRNGFVEKNFYRFVSIWLFRVPDGPTQRLVITLFGLLSSKSKYLNEQFRLHGDLFSIRTK